MIRQICPSCFQPIDLPDDAAGTTATCPLCAKAFPVPGAYVPAVDADRPPPPPGLVLPPEPQPAASAGDGIAPAAPAGPMRECALTLSPQWVAWIAPAALSAVALLSFVGWVGAFPGGYRVFTQSPWQALFGWFSDHTLSEAAAREHVELYNLVRSNVVLMLPYLVLLIGALALVWADRLDWRPDPSRLPPAARWVASVWPIRRTVAAGFAAAALVLIVLQTARGFGLESAVEERVAQLAAKDREARATPGEAAVPPSPFLLGELAGRYSVAGTTARDVALFLHAIAVLGLFGQLWLDARGPKPPPRLALHW